MSNGIRKDRYNIALNPNVKRAGVSLAKSRNRSFSNFVESLILQESARAKSERSERKAVAA
jgi:hypothetical protein